MQLTEMEMNVLAVAIDHMYEHLDNLIGELDTFEGERNNLKRIEAVKALSLKLQSKVKTYYIKQVQIKYDHFQIIYMNKKNNDMYLTLFQRLKPEFKQKLEDYKSDYPYTHESIMKSFNTEFFFVNVRYGTADEACEACGVTYFGDLFEESK